MMEITLVAEIQFLPDGPYQFRFPITGPVRLSLWPAVHPLSTPAELPLREPVYAGGVYVVRIRTLLVPGLENLLRPGAAIRLGAPPTRIAAQGRILKVGTNERQAE